MNGSDYRPSVTALLVGAVVFVATLAAWLYGELHNINTGVLFVLATPVVMTLFAVDSLKSIAGDARTAATQTNGAMDGRMQAAVAAALAARDAARTRQAMLAAAPAQDAQDAQDAPPRAYPGP